MLNRRHLITAGALAAAQAIAATVEDTLDVRPLQSYA